MNAKQLVIASVVIAATSAAVVPLAFAGERMGASATEIVQARQSGQMRPAGEAAEYRRFEVFAGTSRSRADVIAETLRARSEGTLIAAGEAFAPNEAATFAPSMLARSAVREDVLAARAHGALIPSGATLLVSMWGNLEARDLKTGASQWQYTDR